jgi:outer membrane protein TolC
MWCLLAVASAQERVAVVIDGTEALPGFDVEAVETAVQDLAGGMAIELPPELVFYGGWTRDGAADALTAAYAAKPDAVLTMGLLGSDAALSRASAPVPTVAPMVLDATLQANVGSTPSGVYTVALTPSFDRDLRALREIAGTDDIGLMVFQPYLELLPEGEEPAGFVQVVPTSSDLSETIARIGDGVEGVVVTPQPHLSEAEQRELAASLTAEGLASFTTQSEDVVALGYLAGFADGGASEAIVRRTALITLEVLRGRRPPPIKANSVDPGDIVLNAVTLDALALSVPHDVLIQARVIQSDEASDGPVLDMRAAIDGALDASPELAAAQRDLEADRQDILRAWSNWMPQFDIGLGASFLDPAIADASFGTQVPTSVTGTATVQQLLYDEQARTNVPIQRALQEARVAAYVAQAQDLSVSVGTAYVDALRADALIDIRRNDLSQVRANLQAARVRVSVGDATTAEVARWESELANSRSNLVDAFVTRLQTRLRVNQLMGRAPDTPFETDPEFAQNALEVTSTSPIAPWMDDPESYGKLIDALVQVGLDAAPELRQIDHAIRSQKLFKGAAVRSYFVPQVAGQFQGVWNAYREQGEPIAIPGLDNLPIGQQPDAYWSAGISLSLPIFPGMSREADIRQARESLASLAYQRAQVSLALELRIQSAAASNQGNYRRAMLAREALAGAERNLDWARDAYARGLATQVQLLEARAAWLNAQIGEADARFAYAATLLELQRSVAHMPDGSNTPADLTKRLREVLDTSGGTP